MKVTDLAVVQALIQKQIPKEVHGKDGAPGPQGPEGPQGPTGATGKPGKAGPVGKAGKDGKDGVRGLDGSQGPQGPKGPKGDKGQRGDKGIAGPVGKAGPAGAKGPKGDTGAAGRAVKSVKVNNENMLVVTYDDGDMDIAGKVSVTNKTEVFQNGQNLPPAHFAINNVSLDDNDNLIVRCNHNKVFTVPVGTKAIGGYEFTGGFADRTVGQTGTSDVGSNVSYTSADVAANRWRRFGFSTTRQIANDQPYWGDSGDPNEAPAAGTTDYEGVGLFSGAYMPSGVTSMFNFTQDDTYNQAVTTGDNPYTAAIGSLDWSQCQVGDFAEVRFDFNITPQFANTTVEVGLIFATRDADDNITFTFPLLTNPIFFGQGTVGKTFLNRPIITAYFASQEDVNARALPAIRADQPVLIQPLTLLTSISR